MRRIVVDASVVTKLFTPADERHVDQAIAILGAMERGEVVFVGPSIVFLEVMNVGARKWGLDEPALLVLAQSLQDLGIVRRPVDLDRVATWAALGMTSYDAAYVAVAEAEHVPLLTDDDDLVRRAPGIAIPLSLYPSGT